MNLRRTIHLILTALPRAVHRYGIQLLHCTSNTAPLWSPVPLVLTLHDIIFLEPRDKQNHSIYQNLGWLYRRLDVPRIFDKWRRIITVSNFEKQKSIPSFLFSIGIDTWKECAL